jgi:diaminopimelate decarboxylase
MLLGTQRINEKNHLEIGGCDVVELAGEFGTPLYVMDEALIRGNCRRFKEAFDKEYGDGLGTGVSRDNGCGEGSGTGVSRDNGYGEGSGTGVSRDNGSGIAYASKAFIVSAMCALAAQEGMWLDVASAGELHTARQAGFPMDRLLLHGNYKTQDELAMAVEFGVRYVVVDSLGELEGLDAMARASGKVQDILIRCNPGVDPHTHRLIRTGQEDSKFGFNIKSGAAMEAVRAALGLRGLRPAGVHCHVGSQLFDLTPFIEAVPVMAEFMRQVSDETGVELEVLDMGGGLGVRYLADHNPPPIEEFAKTVGEAVICAVAEAGVSKPMLIVEPGRSIVGEAGTTIYTVGPIKEVSIPEDPGARTYLSVDGGLSDNPRPALYDALYSAMLANRAGDDPAKAYTVSGRHCETDTLIPSVVLPEARTGDLLAVQTTGAYGHAMASNYNRFARPAVVFVMDGRADLVARRETLDDLVRCDIVPDRLLNT